MMRWRGLVMGLLVGLGSLTLRAQSLEGWQAQGRFLKDSLQVGVPIPYSISLERDPAWQVLFPDTGSLGAPAFGAFEVLERRFSPTRKLTNGRVYDSVTYTLLSFSGDSLQTLALPVQVLKGLDSLPVFIPGDTVRLYSALQDTSQVLVPQVELRRVAEEFNYLYWGGGAVVVLVILALLNAFLGKPAQRWVRLLLLWRRHQAFLSSFERLQQASLREQNPRRLEQAMSLWKKHMERLGDRPFTTYTSREIERALDDPRLGEVLRAIDRWVYGGVPVELESLFPPLREQAGLYYQRRREVINRV